MRQHGTHRRCCCRCSEVRVDNTSHEFYTVISLEVQDYPGELLLSLRSIPRSGWLGCTSKSLPWCHHSLMEMPLAPLRSGLCRWLSVCLPDAPALRDNVVLMCRLVTDPCSVRMRRPISSDRMGAERTRAGRSQCDA